MTDKNSDDKENVVSLKDFKNKLNEKLAVEKTETLEKAANFETVEQKRSFAIDALTDILSYAVIQMHTAAATSEDEATVQLLQNAISTIDMAVLDVLHIIRVKSPK